MKLSGNNIFYLFTAMAVFSACSTKRNTAVSRAYQNLTARYNVYYNAKESLKSGLQRMEQAVQEDYTHILPVYKSSYPDAAKAATSEMELAILKCSKLIALHSITKSPGRRSNQSEKYKRFASKGEYNKWVDDSYLLMGKASYYMHDYHRANENLNYVIRKFPDNKNVYLANLWLARNYTETGENEKALETFNLLDRERGFPKSLRKDLQIAWVNYFLKNNELPDACSHLKTALQSHFPKKENLRYHYILAQLSAALDQRDEALLHYRKVLKMKPPYIMAFNARIAALELSANEKGNTDKQLQKLLDDQNNLEFLDRIYYAKGQIALHENRKSDALNNFMLSVKASTSNNKQRALSSLSAARMLFDEDNYVLSACYYDSAMAVIDNTYPGYAEIKTRAENLRRLADNLNSITREDSLQRIARMPEAERNNFINKLIADLQQKEMQKKIEENKETSDQNYFRAQQYRPQIRVQDNQNLWYFYNPTTVGIGKSEFQRIWGRRSLEDNWRRKNKISVNQDEMQQLAQEIKENASTETKKKAADPKTREYYLQDLPLTDSLRRISDDKIKAAYFNAGRIYQTDINDPGKAIPMFEDLNKRFPGSLYELPSWFELFRIYKQQEDPNAILYKDKITRYYPGSKYALYLMNPRYFEDSQTAKAAIEKKYSETLSAYQSGNLADARKLAGETLALNPDSSIYAKASFIEIVSGGPGADRTALSASLDKYIASFPKASTRQLAVQIRDLIKVNALNDIQQMVSKGYLNEKIVNEELKQDAGTKPDEFGGKYSYDENMFHYFVIAFSREAAIDVNRLIYDIANYNLDYYTSTDFDIEQVNLNSGTRMVVVRGFPDKQEGLIYFRSVIRKRQVYQALKNIEYVNFIASSGNYRKIVEDQNYLDYLRFFTKNYSPYYSTAIPADELPPPVELIATARKAEEPSEKGKFVLVKPEEDKEKKDKETQVSKESSPLTDYKGPYRISPAKGNLFALVFQPAEVDSIKLMQAFKASDRIKSGAESSKITISALDDFRSILLIPVPGELTGAIEFYNNISRDQTLFGNLNPSGYRHFIISPGNLEILKKEKNLKEYFDFFNLIRK